MDQTSADQPAQALSSFDQIIKDSKPEDLPWFRKELDDLKPHVRELFEKYSRVPPDDVVPHIVAQRNKAFNVVRNFRINTKQLLI